MARGTILVVKDHPLNTELAVELLEAAGYMVLQAADDLEPPESDAPGRAENA